MTTTRQKQLGWERRQDLLRYLRTHGSASVATICDVVGVSPATVHRDLDFLAERGLIERVHGGALSLEALDDPPVTVERHKRVGEKHRIAAAALQSMDKSVSSIFLEASTTVAYLAPALRAMEDLVVVTNSPEIALELVAGKAEVVLIGGNLRHRTLSTVGPLAIQALGAVSIDLAFIGISALDVGGVSSMNMIEAETKSAIINAAARVVALGDGGKLGRRSLVPVAPLSALDELVTDDSAPADKIEELRAGGLTVTVARTHGEG